MKRSIIGIDSLSSSPMPIDKPSIRVFFDDESLRLKFKQLAVVAKSSMTKRVVQFIKKDVAFWEETGEVLDLDILDEAVWEVLNEKTKVDSQIESQDFCQTNGHQKAEVFNKNANDRPISQLEAYKNGELQIRVTNPRKEHKRYKGKIGDALTDLGDKLKVYIEGDIENFYDDEIELIDGE